MAGLGGFDIRGLERFQKDLNKVKEAQLNEFLEACTKELAARLLAKVIRRTPVGDYDTYWTDSDGTRIVDAKNKGRHAPEGMDCAERHWRRRA